ncbi:hypothetical protein RJT34_01215 [Clitoria ternatea]|uniref:Uncharacterized protein n=1 Tax=Clitoria ternatea TaxID=43366 RepID=A0AAN9KG22_CLITE
MTNPQPFVPVQNNYEAMIITDLVWLLDGLTVDFKMFFKCSKAQRLSRNKRRALADDNASSSSSFNSTPAGDASSFASSSSMAKPLNEDNGHSRGQDIIETWMNSSEQSRFAKGVEPVLIYSTGTSGIQVQLDAKLTLTPLGLDLATLFRYTQTHGVHLNFCKDKIAMLSLFWFVCPSMARLAGCFLP